MATRVPGPRLTRLLALLFALTAIGPLLLVALPFRASLLGHERRQILADSQTLARTAAALARQQMLACEVVLDQLQNMLDTHGTNDGHMADLLDRVVATTPSLESVYVVGRDSRILAVGLPADRAGVRGDYVGLDMSGLPVLAEARRAGSAVWSDAYRSVVTGKLSATVAKRRGELAVLAHLGLERLRHSADSEVDGGADRCLALLDRHGNVVFSEQPDVTTDRLLWADLTTGVKAGRPSSEQVTVAGQAFLASVAPVADTGWWTLVCHDAEAAFRPLHRWALVFWAVGALAALLAGLAGWLVARRVTRPLVHLHDAALALASGDYSARLPQSRYVEIAGLANAFGAMSAAVQAREADLRSLAESVSECSGQLLYESIIAEVTRLTSADTALLTEFVAGGHCRSFVGLIDGQAAEPIEYDLADTPCALAARQGFALYERDVQRHFPDDADLRALRAEAYVGLALRDESGQPIGTLVALSRQPMVVPDLAREALSILATRASTELSRERAARERVALEARLSQASRLEAIGQLAGGVAHDFNNLLTSIRGYADMLAESPLDEQQRDDLTQVLAASQRAAALTRQLLTFSRRQVVQPCPVDLSRVITDLRPMLEPILGEDITFRIDLPGEPVWILADPTQIEQVIVNLAVNARAAMPRGGTLSLALTTGAEAEPPAVMEAAPSRHGYCLMTIADSGCGMDAATRDRIFEPFFSTKPAGEGTGLGLSTVYGVVRQAEGHIACESAPGEGAMFRIWLPRVPSGQAGESLTVAEAVPEGARETVLVVEDAEAVRRLATRILSQHGYRVLDAALPSAALGLLDDAGQRIDLLFTDVVMPEMDGVELADRARQVRADLPVVFTSGYADQSRAEGGIERFGARLLPKPYSSKALLQVVREQLEGIPRRG